MEIWRPIGVEILKKVLVVQGGSGRGLFSFVFSALTALQKAESLNAEVYVNLSHLPGYKDPLYTLTSNVWEYYFEQPSTVREADLLAHPEWILETDTYVKNHILPFLLTEPVRNTISALIQKYIRIHPEIIDKAHAFWEANNSSYKVLGIHKRGTDYAYHMNPIPLSTYFEAAEQKLSEGFEKIFLATDEVAMIEAFQKKFGDRLSFYPCEFRSKSSSPIHLGAHPCYQLGEEAILEALCLSKSQHLLKTSSNVSSFSACWNPKLSWTHLDLQQEHRA